MRTRTFTPTESMNPVYLGSCDNDLYSRVIEAHGGRTLAEVKEDGYRVQVHKRGNVVKAFTRSKNQVVLELFPELESSLSNLPNCIVDSELVSSEKDGIEGFDQVKRRFRSNMGSEGIRKYLDSGIVQEMPLSLVVFDTLSWEGRSLIDKTLTERRKYTERVNEKKIEPSRQKLIKDPKELERWFGYLVGDNYEGLVCKNPDSLYIPGGRTEDWIKLKRSESLDLAVLGVYLDGDSISQILCGPYNVRKGKFETLAKVNAKREGINKELERLLENFYVKNCPPEITVNPKMERIGRPDSYVSPNTVVEICAMNFSKGDNYHSCGLENNISYSLRIAWLKSIREDKSVRDITTTDQIKKMYEQERKS